MSDLTEYDREIVAAAERFVDCTGGQVGATYQRLDDAVQAKRDAQRPRCTYQLCNKPAVQGLEPIGGWKVLDYRCDEHRIEVRDL